MTREATWARTGVNVEGLGDVAEVIKAAGLDYTVEKVPVYLPSGAKIDGKFATIQQGTDKVFGVVGNNYTICQNTDAFDFVNYIEDDLKFVKAGQTGNGIIYIIGQLPENYVLGDKFAPHVIFQNGHDAIHTVKAAIAPLRIICQNQFNMAFKKAQNSVTIKHAATLDFRLKNAREVLKTSAEYMNTFSNFAEDLASIDIKGKEHHLVESFYMMPADATEVKAERVEEKRMALLEAYHIDDNSNFTGTGWGMVNAFSDVLTHAEPIRKVGDWQDSVFAKVTFNPNMMHKFIKHVKEYA